ncbi:MAG: YgiQ family radical SAM protein [Bacteriovoracaceae bacterium]|nr:YgiQ family radical SAM protein [Bacteriovoracaceae bacterium]
MSEFPPSSAKEMKRLELEQLDVILVTGDAYVDHPSFGNAVIVRTLQSLGLTVGVIPQPNWQDDLRDFKKLGTPRLFFAVSAGCMDSMVNHYTASKRLRSDDAYTPGGQSGFRPDYPTKVYTKILKDIFPESPVLIGGVEASLRRVTHYDYWQDQLLPSMLAQSGADLLVYGMGEKPLTEIVNLLQKGVPFYSLKTIPQTAVLLEMEDKLPKNKNWTDFTLNSHEDCSGDPLLFASNFKVIEEESNQYQSELRLIQHVGDKTLIINPPFAPMSEKEIDGTFDLPYTRVPHPRYRKKGIIPAYEMIKNSVNLHRGCFGGCAFCTISAHQGKFIASRSEKSILNEIESMKQVEGFNGVLSDLGGPSANMYTLQGIDLNICKKCKRPSCIFPAHCNNLNSDHNPLINIYKKVRETKGIKHVFIGSGIRYDLFMSKKDNGSLGYDQYLSDLVEHHVSGKLKVAPEHTDPKVLKYMRKPSFSMFIKLKTKFERLTEKFGKKQEIVPYFISSHPTCDEKEMATLAVDTAELGYKLRQIQDFTPTPMTLATVSYYSGVDPYTMNPVFVAKTKEQKLSQRRYFFWYLPDNNKWIRARMKAFDLIERAKKMMF